MHSFPTQIGPEIKDILQNLQQYEYPGIYINKEITHKKNLPFLFVLTGPTGSGKTTFLNYLSSFYHKVTTATSRQKRDDESDDSYIWMTEKKKENETIDDYILRLKEKYYLVETNFFADNVYGTPKSSILSSIQLGNSIIGIDNEGVKSLLNLENLNVNIVILFILPDSIDSIYKRVNNTRNDLEKRIETAKKELSEASEITNYFIHNTELKIYCDENEIPLERTKYELLNFTRKLIEESNK